MSLTYDGFDLTRYAFVTLERPVGPSMRIETEQIPGRRGSLVTEVLPDSLTIIAHCTLRRKYLSRWNRVRAELAATFTKQGECMLTLPDEPGRYRMATASLDANVALPLIPPITFTITFVCHDPIAYGAGSSATVPSGGSVEVEIGGMVATTVTIFALQAYRDQTSGLWGLKFDEGDFLHVDTGSNYNRRVDIDCEKRVVKVANALAMVTLDSNWPKLEPGTHVIRMDQGTGAATVSWIERYV